MIDGLWSVQIGVKETEMQQAGVLVLENQRLLGGSNDYFYRGHYQIVKGVLDGEMTVTFCGRKESPFFQPRRRFRLRFMGKIRSRIIKLENFMIGDPEKNVLLFLIKRSPLT